MYQTVYIHNRSASPTVRPADARATLEPGDPNTITAVAQRMPANTWTSLASLSPLKRHHNGIAEQQQPGQSFTTFSIPRSLGQSEPELPHTVLDVGYLQSMELPRDILDGLRKGFEGAPVMHCCERTGVTLERNLANKTGAARLCQRFDNAEYACHQLEQRYDAFAHNAKALLAAADGGGAGASSVSLPLLGIMSSIWPGLRFENAGERQAWLERTLRDPRPFVAQSYDALDLGLARAGLAISFAKKDASEGGGSLSEAERSALLVKMRDADTAYRQTREAFSRSDIPIDPDLLRGHSILAALRRLE